MTKNEAKAEIIERQGIEQYSGMINIDTVFELLDQLDLKTEKDKLKIELVDKIIDGFNTWCGIKTYIDMDVYKPLIKQIGEME